MQARGQEQAQVQVQEQARARVQAQEQGPVHERAQEQAPVPERVRVRGGAPKRARAPAAAITPRRGNYATDPGRSTSRLTMLRPHRFPIRKSSIPIKKNPFSSGRPTTGTQHCDSGHCLTTRS